MPPTEPRAPAPEAPVASGERTILRPLSLADAETLQRWWNDAELRHLSYPYSEFFTRREVEDAISKSLADRFLLLGVESIQDGRLVGQVALRSIEPVHRTAEVGVVLDPSAWGRGIGREGTALLLGIGFGQLGLAHVVARVWEYNERSLRLFRGLRFKEEGRLRKHHFSRGRHWDEVVLGLTDDEWAATRA